MRVVLFTGKGGVGKTSLAAATAVRAARRGARTLVTSTDPAHSLADALGQPLGSAPVAVGDRLEAQQVDARARLEAHWRRIQEYLVAVLRQGGVPELEAEELSVLPGLEEVFALADVGAHVDAGRHDLVVVDCAPTAETLRLLSLPQALGWYLQRLAPLGRAWNHLLRPLLGADTALPAPGPDLMSAVEQLQTTLERIRAVLVDADTTSLRMVANPERVVVAETRRLLGQLSLFGYPVDALVMNRLLPDHVTDPHFASAKRRQGELLDEVRGGFAGLPTLTAPLLPDEPVGADGLAELADAVYADIDEQAVLYRRDQLRIERTGAGWSLRLELPFVDREDLHVLRRGDELFVRVGAATRPLVLPAALQRAEVTGARLHDGELTVHLEEPHTNAASGATSATKTG